MVKKRACFDADEKTARYSSDLDKRRTPLLRYHKDGEFFLGSFEQFRNNLVMISEQ